MGEFVIFTLEEKEYGIDIESVIEISEMMSVTRVPKAPEYIKGVINLRGDIVPVMDLRRRLNLAEKEVTEDTRIVVTMKNDIKAGIIVDEVVEVIPLKNDQVENTSGFNDNQFSEYLYGLGKIERRIISLLDIENLLKLEQGV